MPCSFPFAWFYLDSSSDLKCTNQIMQICTWKANSHTFVKHSWLLAGRTSCHSPLCSKQLLYRGPSVQCSHTGNGALSTNVAETNLKGRIAAWAGGGLEEVFFSPPPHWANSQQRRETGATALAGFTLAGGEQLIGLVEFGRLYTVMT